MKRLTFQAICLAMLVPGPSPAQTSEYWTVMACDPLAEVSEDIMRAHQKGASASLLMERAMMWVPEDALYRDGTRQLLQEIIDIAKKVPKLRRRSEQIRVAEDFGETILGVCADRLVD